MYIPTLLILSYFDLRDVHSKLSVYTIHRSQLLITQWEYVSYTILESVALYSNINALSNLIKSEELDRSQLQKIRLQNMFCLFSAKNLAVAKFLLHAEAIVVAKWIE